MPARKCINLQYLPWEKGNSCKFHAKNILLVERTANPIVLLKVHSPNLSPPDALWVCNILQLPVFLYRADKERWGERTFCMTMGVAVLMQGNEKLMQWWLVSLKIVVFTFQFKMHYKRVYCFCNYVDIVSSVF